MDGLCMVCVWSNRRKNGCMVEQAGDSWMKWKCSLCMEW